MFDTPASPRTMRTLAVVTLALRPKLFPATVVAAAVGRDKATVSRRVARVGELMSRYNRAESEAVRDDLAVAIEAVCDSLAPGLTPAVLRAAHRAERRKVAQVAALFAAAEQAGKKADGEPHRDAARRVASARAEAVSEFEKRDKACRRIASARGFVVMAHRHYGRPNPKK